MAICEQCGNPEKFVKAGRRKDGSTWPDFWVCERCKPRKQDQKSAQVDNDQGQEILAKLEDIEKELKEVHERLTQSGIWQQGEFDTLADLIKEK